MQITQVSERKLICKKDGAIREVIKGVIGTTAFWIILGFLISLCTSSKQSFTPNLGMITYIIFCLGVIVLNYDDIAIFDLDSHSLRTELYFPLFKKCYSREYDFSTIGTILVENKRGSVNYLIVIRQHNGDTIYLPSPRYCTDILIVDAEAQKIRDFLKVR